MTNEVAICVVVLGVGVLFSLTLCIKVLKRLNELINEIETLEKVVVYLDERTNNLEEREEYR